MKVTVEYTQTGAVSQRTVQVILHEKLPKFTSNTITQFQGNQIQANNMTPGTHKEGRVVKNSLRMSQGTQGEGRVVQHSLQIAIQHD